jgi:Tfp pilus assembly PilM family ATPase
MPKLLAIEWDAREARMAVATATHGRARVEDVFAVPLVAEDGETPLDDAEATRRISAAIASRQLSRSEALIAVARASIELKLLSLPPAPNAEVPEMVRFQAVKEFNNLGDDWPLDFISCSGGESEPRTVLAAALAPAVMNEILGVCRAAELEAKHMVLRPSAAASLLRRQKDAARVRMLVDVLVDEADLTVLVGETVVFMRTARVSHGLSDVERSTALVAETRRTLAAVSNQLSGQKVERLYVCGVGPTERALAAAVEEQLRLPATVFDPLADLDRSTELSQHPPKDAGRYGPLLGMLLDEAAEIPHAIDFLAPKKKPQPRSHKREYMLASAVGALLLVVGIGGTVHALWSRDDENAALALRVENNKKRVTQAQQAVKEWDEIDKWQAGDISWIDRLAMASTRMPPADEMMLTKLQITSDTRGPAATVDGVAKNAAAIDAAENSMRNDHQRVDSKGSAPDTTVSGFTRKFTSQIRPYDPAAEEAAAKRAAAKKPQTPISLRAK